MGVFIIQTASINRNVSNFSINICFADKMVLLDGSVGGTLSGPITHSPIYVEDDTVEAGFRTEGVKFYNLIYSLVTEFGNIPSSKVIIDDVDLLVKNAVYNSSDNTLWVARYGESWGISVAEPSADATEKYAFNYGEDTAYAYTDFIYPLDKELTSGPGESVESVLKQITL